MNDKESVEEVPLDLFNQVSLNDFEPVEVVDLPNQQVKEQSKVISIPADAYKAILEKERNAKSQTPLN